MSEKKSLHVETDLPLMMKAGNPRRVYDDDFYKRLFKRWNVAESDQIRLPFGDRESEATFNLGVVPLLCHQEGFSADYQKCLNRMLDGTHAKVFPKRLVLMCFLEGAAAIYKCQKEMKDECWHEELEKPGKWAKIYFSLAKKCESLLGALSKAENINPYFSRAVLKNEVKNARKAINELAASLEDAGFNCKKKKNTDRKRNGGDEAFNFMVNQLLIAWSDLLGQEISTSPNASHRKVCKFLAETTNKLKIKKSYDALRKAVINSRQIDTE